MKKLEKSNSKRILGKLAKSISLCLLAFVSIFFVACGQTSSAKESGFDANGRYRLNAPNIIHYNQTSDGTYNEYTGSFLVPMEFYNGNDYKSQTSGLDAFNLENFLKNYDQVGNWAISENDGTRLSSTDLLYPDYTFWVDGIIYQVHVSVNLSQLEIVRTAGGSANSYFNATNYVSALDDLSNIFKFSYRVGTSGVWQDADGFISAVYLKVNDATNTTDVISGELGNQDESYDKVFYMAFNPILQNGNTTRRIRVKATPNANISSDLSAVGSSASVEYKNRGDSIYSQTIVYKAYKMSFESYSPNSAYLDYGQLSYDKNKFFFYDEQTTFSLSTNKYYLTKIDGYFPEGRIVEVNREFDNDANGDDYALQSWTANRKGQTTLVTQETILNGINFDLFEDYDRGYHSLFGTTLNEKYFAIKSFINDSDVYSNGSSYTTFENITISNDQSTRTGTVYVVSKSDYNNYTFYANFIKVNNFVLKGTLFDAEKILNVENAKLENVSYQIYNKDGVAYPDKSGTTADYTFEFTGLAYGDYVVFTKEDNTDPDNPISYKFYGNDISGLTVAGDSEFNVLKNYVTRETKLTAIVVTEIYNNVVSYVDPDSMSFVFNNRSYYVDENTVYDSNGNECTNFSVEYIYKVLDLTNVSVLATKYDDDTSLVVNVYALNNGDLIDPTEQGISYEVIKSVTSHVDQLGFVKTTVYVSVVLPSNATVQSYNVITDNSININLFQNSNNEFNKILKIVTLKNKEQVTNYYYVDITSNLNSSQVTVSSNGGNYLIYNDEYFAYAFKNVYNNTNYYIYQSCVSENMLVSYTSGSTQLYDFLDLETINYSTNSSDANYLAETAGGTISTGSIYSYILFNGYTYFLAPSDMDISIEGLKLTSNLPNEKLDVNVSYVNEINFDEESIIQSILSSNNRTTYTKDETFNIYSGRFSIVGNLVDKYFYNLKVSAEYKLNDATHTIKSEMESLDPVVLSIEQVKFENSSEQTTYFTFYYDGVKYYYFSGKVYSQYDQYGETHFYGEISPDSNGFYEEFDYAKAAIDTSTQTVVFSKPVFTYLNRTYYLKIETTIDGKTVYTLHSDFFCTSDPIDFVSAYGYKNYSITGSNTSFSLTLVRYSVSIQSSLISNTYYINPESEYIFTNFECTQILDSGDDQYEID